MNDQPNRYWMEDGFKAGHFTHSHSCNRPLFNLKFKTLKSITLCSQRNRSIGVLLTSTRWEWSNWRRSSVIGTRNAEDVSRSRTSSTVSTSWNQNTYARSYSDQHKENCWPCPTSFPRQWSDSDAHTADQTHSPSSTTVEWTRCTRESFNVVSYVL